LRNLTAECWFSSQRNELYRKREADAVQASKFHGMSWSI
jgi:hypothetical protein